MITYDIDKKQPKKSKKSILETKLKIFLSALIALIFTLALAFLFSK
ncbi:hypothetical protein [Helicobacter phage FrGC43A]|nr:hypothetical protein [Helicobacter phage FrGC43A]